MEEKKSPPERLAKRKCPVCQTPIFKYVFIGLYTPLENNAFFYAERLADTKSPIAGMPVGVSNLAELNNLFLEHECTDCGFISIWGFTKEELIYLRTNGNEYGVSWLYEPNTWKKAIESLDDTTHPNVTTVIKNIAEMTERAYGKQLDKQPNEVIEE